MQKSKKSSKLLIVWILSLLFFTVVAQAGDAPVVTSTSVNVDVTLQASTATRERNIPEDGDFLGKAMSGRDNGNFIYTANGSTVVNLDGGTSTGGTVSGNITVENAGSSSLIDI